MRYHGAQPAQGVEPGELYRGVEKSAMAVLESFFLLSPLDMDQRWVRLGALQIHLERGMPATRRTVELALADCELLVSEDYGGQWRREAAFRTALEQVRQQLRALHVGSEGEETCNILVDLGRDRLIPELIAREIEKLRSGQ